MFRRLAAPAARRLLSTQAKEVPASTKQKNAALALALLGAVGAIYFTAINKMKQTDELETIINQEETRADKK